MKGAHLALSMVLTSQRPNVPLNRCRAIVECSFIVKVTGVTLDRAAPPLAQGRSPATELKRVGAIKLPDSAVNVG